MTSLPIQAHFSDYRQQTYIKHIILEKYIFAYFNAIKNQAGKNLVYIDGFAGRGTYDTDAGRVPGSPLRALQKIASHADLANKVTTAFIEQNIDLYKQLAAELNAFHALHPQIRRPEVIHGRFAEEISKKLDEIDQLKSQLAPAFVFIDPCGVDGVDFSVIDRILRTQSKAEVFVFFNIEGVRRILGLNAGIGPTLTTLLGSSERATELVTLFNAHTRPSDREQLIIGYYETLLRTHTPAKYVVSFQIEKEDKKITSHYLVHASQHPLGFGIMKDVMWGVGRTPELKKGLTFAQASVAATSMLFTPTWDGIKQAITDELGSEIKRVSHFTKTLAHNPDNKLCSKAYKDALLELEQESRVTIYDKLGLFPAPFRPMRKGLLTLADDYHVKRA